MQLGNGNAKLNYERCSITENTIYLGETLARIGIVNVRHSGEKSQSLVLPNPKSDFLVTYVTDCDNAWNIEGFANVNVEGRKINANCIVNVPGIVDSIARLTIDFTEGDMDDCNGRQYSVELDGGMMTINGGAEVNFGTMFKSIIVKMSPCGGDYIHIKRTYDDTELVLIEGGGGSRGKCLIKSRKKERHPFLIPTRTHLALT